MFLDAGGETMKESCYRVDKTLAERDVPSFVLECSNPKIGLIAEICAMKGKELNDKKQFKNAEIWLRKAISLYPDSPDYYIGLMASLKGQNDYI